MTGAHGAAGGFNVESLFLAVPLIVLGVAMFVQKKSPPAVPVALVGIGLLFAVGGFTFLAGEEPTEYGALFHSLCETTETAADDPAAAATRFNNEAHSPLHDFADELAGEDREAAAEVLQAKQRVEAAIEQDDDLEPALADLTDAVHRALPAVGEEETTCDAF